MYNMNSSTAQITFLKGTYTLIHIPRHLYWAFAQPITKVLLTQGQSLSVSNVTPQDRIEGITINDEEHGFVNISVTPMEVSVVCHSSFADQFHSIASQLPDDAARQVDISLHDYNVLSVISAGVDPGIRVLELTSPLAVAGIPLFFISTYYTDFILAPALDRHRVVLAFSEHGFKLSSKDPSRFINPIDQGQDRRTNPWSPGYVPPTAPVAATATTTHQPSTTPTSTPPPSESELLQAHAFDVLRRRSTVSPFILDDLQLVHCTARESSRFVPEYYYHSDPRSAAYNPSSTRVPCWVDNLDTRLFACVSAILASQPRFFSVTLAQDDQPALLMDRSLLPVFGGSLVGDLDNSVVPVFLNLTDLPLEVSGIVYGVAGRLVKEMGRPELTYLSTARASAVVLPEKEAQEALKILKPLLQKD